MKFPPLCLLFKPPESSENVENFRKIKAWKVSYGKQWSSRIETNEKSLSTRYIDKLNQTQIY